MKHPLFLSLVVFGFAVGLGFSDDPEKPKTKQEPNVLKAVIHINFSDSDRQKNVTNILKEIKGDAEIVVV